MTRDLIHFEATGPLLELALEDCPTHLAVMSVPEADVVSVNVLSTDNPVRVELVYWRDLPV